jgi:hypothetical protein
MIMIMNRKFGRKQAYSVSRPSSNFLENDEIHKIQSQNSALHQLRL